MNRFTLYLAGIEPMSSLDVSDDEWCYQNDTVDCSLVHHFSEYCSNVTFAPFSSECQFVTEQCINSSAVLINYIGFIYCTMEHAQVGLTALYWLVLWWFR